jgi:hypothetical protein
MYSVEKLLSEFARDRFYGSVEIKFEAGKPVLLRKTETIKPTDDCRENRGDRNERMY